MALAGVAIFDLLTMADAAHKQKARAPDVLRANQALSRLSPEQRIDFVRAGAALVKCADDGRTYYKLPSGPASADIMSRLNNGTCNVSLKP